jgi:hypothetical protein
VIRQAISCDICGTEKKQSNHWFVVHDQGGELRLSGWNSRNRLRPGTKHLCGQTCLHKLVDDFMAKALAMRQPQSAVEEADAEEQIPAAGVRKIDSKTTESSLISNAAYEEVDSSARLIAPAQMPASPTRPPLRMPVELVSTPARLRAEEPAHLPAQTLDEPPRFASRNWRAEAWEREREREQRTVNRHREIASRRISNSK